MNTTHTDLQLQLALVKELPKFIKHYIAYGNNYFVWKDTDEYVTPREWDWVINKLLNDLEIKYYYDFRQNLAEVCPFPHFATWQQRAIAYFATTGKEIVTQ